MVQEFYRDKEFDRDNLLGLVGSFVSCFDIFHVSLWLLLLSLKRCFFLKLCVHVTFNSFAIMLLLRVNMLSLLQESFKQKCSLNFQDPTGAL